MALATVCSMTITLLLLLVNSLFDFARVLLQLCCGFCVCSFFVIYVCFRSSLAIVPLRMKEMVALFVLCSGFHAFIFVF